MQAPAACNTLSDGGPWLFSARCMWCFPAVRAALPLSFLLLAQCAGSSLPRALTVQKGERTTVVAQTRGMSLKLLNASAVSREKTYSDPQSDLSTKIVDDEAMQGLLDILAKEGFFDLAGPGIAPVVGSLTVEQGERRFTMNPPVVTDPKDPQLLIFGRCHEYVRATFNQTMGFQTREGIGGSDFKNYKESVDRGSKQSMEKMGSKKLEPPK